MNLIFILPIVAMFFLVGCNKEETKTVEWYMAPENKQALHDKISEYRNNPGQLANTPNCMNAQEAADRIVLGGKMYQGPSKEPIGF